MHKARKLFAILLALALAISVLGLAGCGKKTDETSKSTDKETSSYPAFTTITEGKLAVGSDLDYAPFESLKADGTPEGFDVDLVNEIAKELGVTPDYKKEIFDTLIPTLKAGGKIDMIMSAMTIKPERQAEIDFSDPYFDSNQSITMKKGGTYTKPADLAGKKVGVQSGTTGDQWAQENLKPAGAEVVALKGTTEVIEALTAGNIDAMIIDLPVAAEKVKDPALGLEMVAQVPTGEQYGFGISKDNTGLRDAVNMALKKIKDDGRYDAIYTKWFGDIPR